MKKIIAVNGSPRRNGNTAEPLQNALRGAAAEIVVGELDAHGGGLGGGEAAPGVPGVRPPVAGGRHVMESITICGVEIPLQ